MRSGFRKKWDNLNLKVESVFRKRKYQKNAKIRLKRMDGGFNCDKAYEEVIIPYWKKYGYKPAKYWYQIFCDREQEIDPRYIPDDLYYGDMIPYFSNSQFRRFGEDKCYHDIWFADIKRPQTICKNIAGVFYDAEMNLITVKQAVDLCLDYKEEFLIKPSIDSGEGRLIEFFAPDKVTEKDIEKAFKDMEANFIMQASVKQHSVLSRLNPSSLNTIRVVSFFFEGEVHFLSSILRIGATNAKVDNVGAGGFACPVKMDGQLNDKAVNRKAEWVEENSIGIKFKDVRIPYFDKVIETIMQSHKKLAHFKLIGWDFSVDLEGDPVFIEFNVCPGSNQISCGPTFGDLTEKVLEEFFITRSLSNAQN